MKWGSGPVLVVPPGWISHLELQWHDLGMREMYERLAARYELVFYDKRGMGLSERDREDFSLADELADLEVVIDEVTKGPIALFGASQGGPLSIAYAAAHPERVTQLVSVWSVRKRRAHREAARSGLADRTRPGELGTRRRSDGLDLRPRGDRRRRSTPS